jgi:hypothetical protein
MAQMTRPQTKQERDEKAAKPADLSGEETKREEQVNAANNSARENLVFEDSDDLPELSERRQMNNPFQNAVNEIIQSGKAKSVTVASDDQDWARNQIRAAFTNASTEWGARTVVTSAGPGKVKISFKRKPKTQRKS